MRDVFPDSICVGFSEVDPEALKIYLRHFPTHPRLAPVEAIEGTVFRGKVDLIFGGSPCQGLSVAGRRRGLADPRSRLLSEFVRIVKEVQPRYFILENVHHMTPSQLAEVNAAIGCTSTSLDAAWFSAQSRLRRYWANFPIVSPAHQTGSALTDVLLDPGKAICRVISTKILPPPPTDGRPLAYYQKGYGTPLLPRPDGKANTVTCTHSQRDHIWDGTRFRSLRPVELERLQGFPDNFTEGLSINSRHRLMGNAFSVSSFRYILRNLSARVESIWEG